MLKSFPISHGDSHSLQNELMSKDLARKEEKEERRKGFRLLIVIAVKDVE